MKITKDSQRACQWEDKCEGITEIRVQKARAKHKPNLNNALALGFTQHKNQRNLQRAGHYVFCKAYH